MKRSVVIGARSLEIIKTALVIERQRKAKKALSSVPVNTISDNLDRS